MSVKINGISIAGRGKTGAPGKDGKNGENGKSAYQAAIEGGYIGDEQKFNETLANIDNAGSGGGSGKKTVRVTVGTSQNRWNAADCDFLCDGVNDETEINQAIQALPSNGGEVVILDGEYNIQGVIQLNKNSIKLTGNGINTTLKRKFSNFSSAVVNIVADNCFVSNFVIDGNKVEGQSGHNIIINNDNCTICNIHSVNSDYNGIYIKGNNTIVNKNILHDNNEGINVENISKVVISDNISYSNTDGVYITGSNEILVSCNILIGNSNGINMTENTSNNVISNNICNNNETGISLSSGSSNNTLSNNTCNNNTYGFLIESSNNNTISCNTAIRGTGTSGDYDDSQHTIFIFEDANNNLISSNNCMGKAPSISGSTNTSVNNKS